MKSWIRKVGNILGRHALVAALAVATMASLVTYESVRPTSASAAVAAPAAPALAEDSVNPLLSLDRAMETLAARVTPAIVNVAVTSKAKTDDSEMQMPDEMRRFFQGPG